MKNKPQKKYRYKSDSSQAVHEVAQGMYLAGIIDQQQMLEFDQSCLVSDMPELKPKRKTT